MLITNAGYPGQVNLLPAYGDYKSATLAFTLLAPARLRLISIGADGPNDAYGITFSNINADFSGDYNDGAAITFAYGYSGSDPMLLADQADGAYIFELSATNLPPNGDGAIAFSFDIEIETAPDVWTSLAPSHLSSITVTDPDALFGDLPSLAPACFWTNLVLADQVCDGAPADPPPAGAPMRAVSGGGGNVYAEWLNTSPPEFIECVSFNGATFDPPITLGLVLNEVPEYHPGSDDAAAMYGTCGDQNVPVTFRESGVDYPMTVNINCF
jgi:hypothetical protein